MKFRRAADTDNFLKRMISENGIWEVGLIPRTFNRFAVGFNKIGALGPEVEYCCGSIPANIYKIYGLCVQILEKYPEAVSPIVIRRLFPRWRVRPVDQDPVFMKRLIDLASDADVQQKVDLKHIKEFLDSRHRNQWMSADPFYLYCRKGQHVYRGVVYRTFDIANISNLDEKQRGRGLFWKLTEGIKHVLVASYPSQYAALYIESVMNMELYNSLVKRGWESEGFNNFYKFF